MRIIFENNKTCSYEVEYQKDCADANFERANREYQRQNISEDIGEW